jgi:hypothetical protein
LSKDRELRSQWQHAVALLLAQADVDIFSRQVELALFFDGKAGARVAVRVTVIRA